ncbi:hypothetical protein [Paeniglutamicibacter cryotolerans]|uniref:Uncharacterized protein n=1 Tax=Paeniglutamicibacter cryotolerans TaxID=670079 RepID=A0A839QF05_9MICC|nr:hypothetical protein [Paeniglutamicibacter cryotolerans]MBB2994848.1 hypothetical protein [Paeniglutamicibacter cryotolerans]
MGKNPSEQKKPWQQSIKAPLFFSLVLGIVAGLVAMISSTGGSDKPLRIDIGLTAFGIAFVASLLVISVMTMAGKENPSELGAGSGINRASDAPEKKQGS